VIVLQKVVPDLCSETCPHLAPPYNADQVISMKVEDDSDREVGKEPLSVSLPGIKTEHKASSVPVCVHLGSVFTDIKNRQLSFFFPSVCLSLHPHEATPVLSVDFE
jgi:hypothetical protein